VFVGRRVINWWWNRKPTIIYNEEELAEQDAEIERLRKELAKTPSDMRNRIEELEHEVDALRFTMTSTAEHLRKHYGICVIF
jgi:SMC interacting uncharacterized protein involved in chromosome segregation